MPRLFSGVAFLSKGFCLLLLNVRYDIIRSNKSSGEIVEMR